MSDRIFFVASFLVASSFIFVALQPYADRPPRGPVSGGGRNAEDVTIQGEELHRFVPGEVGGLTIERPEGGGEPVLRMSRLAEQIYDDPKWGPHLVLAEDIEYALESRPVEVTIEARAAGDFGASQFEADFLARPGEESGWKVFDLTTEFAPYSFTWHVSTRGQTGGYDYLGVRPVAPDKRRTMDIRSVRIRAVGPKSEPPER
jgi:hypothetical protein